MVGSLYCNCTVNDRSAWKPGNEEEIQFSSDVFVDFTIENTIKLQIEEEMAKDSSLLIVFKRFDEEVKQEL